MADHLKAHAGPPPGKTSSAWNLSTAKAQLSRVVQRALDGEPQRIVRGGHDVVVVVAESSYAQAMRPNRTVVDLFSALRGIDLELERDPDRGRDAPL